MTFNKYKTIRISEKQKEDIKSVLRVNPGMYDNTSHFVRCAVIRLLNAHRLGVVSGGLE